MMLVSTVSTGKGNHSLIATCIVASWIGVAAIFYTARLGRAGRSSKRLFEIVPRPAFRSGERNKTSISVSVIASGGCNEFANSKQHPDDCEQEQRCHLNVILTTSYSLRRLRLVLL
jgi:hypothetical protein